MRKNAKHISIYVFAQLDINKDERHQSKCARPQRGVCFERLRDLPDLIWVRSLSLLY